MKIVYVGDNRNRGNFGCRATSTALSQLISENNQIVGRVTGKYNMWNLGDLFFIQGLPHFAYALFSHIPGWLTIRKTWFSIISKIFRRGVGLTAFDFVRINPKSTRKNLLKCLCANPTIKEFDLRQYDFDALVVNGEGSFIFATPPWREALIISMLMDWALDMGKKVFFLNAMFSDDPYSVHNEKTIRYETEIFERCDIVSLREEYSLEFCNKYFPNVHPVFTPDALFSWYGLINDGFEILDAKYFFPHSHECDEAFSRYDFSKPYICIAGSSSGKLQRNLQEAVKKYSMLTEIIKKELPLNVYLIQTCEGDEFLNKVGIRTNTPVIPMDSPIVAVAKVLAGAAVFISGRYHPSILASLGGTPCVIMSSNSHKTISLQWLLRYVEPYEFDVLPDENECNKIAELAKMKIMMGKQERDRIKKRCAELDIESRKQIDYLI